MTPMVPWSRKLSRTGGNAEASPRDLSGPLPWCPALGHQTQQAAAQKWEAQLLIGHVQSWLKVRHCFSFVRKVPKFSAPVESSGQEQDVGDKLRCQYSLIARDIVGCSTSQYKRTSWISIRRYQARQNSPAGIMYKLRWVFI